MFASSVNGELNDDAQAAKGKSVDRSILLYRLEEGRLCIRFVQ